METEDNIFKNDPRRMLNLIGKNVSIKTIEDITHTGVLYVIDPVFKNVILHSNWKSDRDHDTILITHHAIREITSLDGEVIGSYLEAAEEAVLVDDDRKSSVKKWLEDMHVDVKESGKYLKIDDVVVIVPPYKPENCICSNTIILEKVQNVLQLMPPDFK